MATQLFNTTGLNLQPAGTHEIVVLSPVLRLMKCLKDGFVISPLSSLVSVYSVLCGSVQSQN